MAGNNNPRNHRERRMLAGKELLGRVDAFAKVKPDDRMAAIHEELMFAIDSSIEEHTKNSRPLTNAQIAVLKDVAYQIVHMLEPMNRKKRGFFRAVWSEFIAAGAITKLTLMGGLLLFLGSCFGGILLVYEKFVKEDRRKVEQRAPTTTTNVPRTDRPITAGTPPAGALGTPSTVPTPPDSQRR